MTHDLPILVIAATGKTGRRVADRLEAMGRRVRRGSRSGTTPFDWNDPATWGPALHGVSAAYVVYSPDLAVPAAPKAIAGFTETAKAKGVERLVLLSGRGEEEAQRCERIVADSGLGWTVVRASWFNQNFDEGAFHDLVLSGAVTLPAGDVLEPFIDIDDIADVAVAALTEDGHDGEIYEVTGPRLMTFADATADIAAATRRDIRYVSIPNEAFQAGLAAAGLDQERVELLDGVERALGRPARDFRDYARDAAATGVWNPQA
ncbi:MAG: NAD(P)H-binding protein [Planctomycetota bacterium]|nr:NAD(P)H-binding protein [Planctomycetota bacterium]